VPELELVGAAATEEEAVRLASQWAARCGADGRRHARIGQGIETTRQIARETRTSAW
jgi:hypothetical protein